MSKISLLVSCCNTQYTEGIYKLDVQDDEVTSITKVFNGDCRGIAKYQEKFVVSSAKRNELMVLDYNFDVIAKMSAEETMAYHGVIVENEQAFVVETNRNAISVYDLPYFKKQGEIRFSTITDANHINDICKVGNRLFISMFALHTEHWRSLPKESGVIVEYSMEENSIVNIRFSNLKRPHSIKYFDNNLWYCDSDRHEVRKGEDVIFRAKDWTRGLTFTQKFIFIGQSDRGNGVNAGVYIFDIIAQTHRFIRIPSKEIYEILVV